MTHTAIVDLDKSKIVKHRKKRKEEIKRENKILLRNREPS